MGKKVIGLMVGSLRQGSYCKAIGKYVSEQLEKKYEIKVLETGNLPFYNEDEDTPAHTLPQWQNFRHQAKEIHALLVITPEYNRSIPAALKNALDVGSRPYGQGVWRQKPCAVISATLGALGGYGVNQHLRQVLGCLDMFLMQQPDAYLSFVADQIDVNGTITSDKLKETLNAFCQAYGQWIERF